MVNKSIKEIIELNKSFYSKHNESFDKSRSYSFWDGFEEISKFIPHKPKILDLGCGNARFLKFLNEKNLNFSDYLGLDNSEEFIKKNTENYKKYRFEVKDVILDINKIDENFDLIVGFGITHHIPSKDLRKEWFENLSSLTQKNGVLILSFWNFDKNKADSNFNPQKYEIEKGDYFLGWKEDFTSHRFCHYFEDSEIEEIVNLFVSFKLLSKFQKDQNTYIVLKRN